MSNLLKGVLAVLGVVSTLIGLFAFFTGNETLPELLGREEKVTIPSNTTAGTIICSGGLPIRLSVGSVAFVSNDSISIRANPGSGGTITDLENGASFDIIDGPRCKGSIAWWQTRANDGRTGWIAEYDNKDYLVSPN